MSRQFLHPQWETIGKLQLQNHIGKSRVIPPARREPANITAGHRRAVERDAKLFVIAGHPGFALEIDDNLRFRVDRRAQLAESAEDAVVTKVFRLGQIFGTRAVAAKQTRDRLSAHRRSFLDDHIVHAPLNLEEDRTVRAQVVITQPQFVSILVALRGGAVKRHTRTIQIQREVRIAVAQLRDRVRVAFEVRAHEVAHAARARFSDEKFHLVAAGCDMVVHAHPEIQPPQLRLMQFDCKSMCPAFA